jgi:hypothetical protein
MRKLILTAILISSGHLFAQQQNPVTPTPPCVIPFSFSGSMGGIIFAPSTTGYDNRQSGCTNWSITYSSTGFTSLHLHVQSAPANLNAPPGSPGTYVDFAGTIVSGINPNTSTTGLNINTVLSGSYPWIRVRLDTLTGTGNVVGVLIGTAPINAGGGSSSSGCVGTSATPCIVAGTDAIGNVSTQPPVQVAGLTGGGNVQPLTMDATPALIVTSLASDPAFTVLNLLGDQNGAVPSTFAPIGNKSQAINLVAGTAAVIAPAFLGESATLLTSLNITLTSALTGTHNMKIVQGTTVSTPCDTGQAVLMGPFYAFQFFGLSSVATSVLSTITPGDDMCILFDTAVTAGGGALFSRN